MIFREAMLAAYAIAMGRRDRFPADAFVGLHVLVVDDDADARELFRPVLEYGGALVTVVATAADALRTLQRVTPDVLVSDIAMPHENGYWLIREVRALGEVKRHRLPAIAITAHGTPSGRWPPASTRISATRSGRFRPCGRAPR